MCGVLLVMSVCSMCVRVGELSGVWCVGILICWFVRVCVCVCVRVLYWCVWCVGVCFVFSMCSVCCWMIEVF